MFLPLIPYLLSLYPIHTNLSSVFLVHLPPFLSWYILILVLYPLHSKISSLPFILPLIIISTYTFSLTLTILWPFLYPYLYSSLYLLIYLSLIIAMSFIPATFILLLYPYISLYTLSLSLYLTHTLTSSSPLQRIVGRWYFDCTQRNHSHEFHSCHFYLVPHGGKSIFG